MMTMTRLPLLLPWARVKADDGIYRTIYIAKLEAVYVLHAFKKKTQKTSKQDIGLAKTRLKTLEAQRK